MDTKTLSPINTVEVQPLTKTNILIVDDRPDGLLALEAVLADVSYNLIQANSGREALHYATYYDFAVILLDVQMPDMDGFETARLLRQSERARHTPIIFVTAINKELRHINKGYETGAVDYIFKPLDPFVLKSKVDIFVELFNKNLQIKQQAQTLRELETQAKEREMLELRQENLKHYNTLADAVPHMIIKVHPEGKIEYFNRRWSEYTGFKAGIDWKVVISPDDRKKFLLFWLHLSRQNLHAAQIEIRIRCQEDGSYRWHLVRVTAELKKNKIANWICTCTDIDSIKKAQEAFRRLSSDLGRSNKELEEFAYVASHDLKEPLHVISSFVDLLEKRVQVKLDNTEKEYVSFIKESVRQAQILIKELLEYSRIGKERSASRIDLSSVLQEVLNIFKAAIVETGAMIQYKSLPSVHASHSEMIQLFQNLIANAIKYRSDRLLEISISAKEEGDFWMFAIKDNGIGIDPQFQERIFGMFQRLHAKSKDSGSGIGLAICKKIVESHGGRIWVESRVNEGATFYFTLKRLQ